MEGKQKVATEQIDTLDNFIQLVQDNFKSIIKVAPITIGFSIFLFYFCKYQFFPSFDLFSLGSLLIAAAVLGLLVFGLIMLGACGPGLFWSEIFLKDKEVIKELNYYLPKDEKLRKPANATFIRSYFLCPTTLCACTSIYILISDNEYARYFIALPMLACLALALELKSRYELSTGSLVIFILASTISYTSGTLISVAVGIASIKTHVPDSSEFYQILMLLLVAITMNLVFAIFAISLQNLKTSNTIFFGTLLSLILSFGNKAWEILPEGIAKALGVGNYTAEEIHIKGEPCEIKTIPWKQKESEQCTLGDTKIIWSLGDTYRIRVQVDGKMVDVSIPASDVISVIKPVDNDKKAVSRDQS
nr:hypothetical protein [uncultured Pseudomonas sp.]